MYMYMKVLDQTPPATMEKVKWEDVVKMGEQVSKQATIGTCPACFTVHSSWPTDCTISAILVLSSWFWFCGFCWIYFYFSQGSMPSAQVSVFMWCNIRCIITLIWLENEFKGLEPGEMIEEIETEEQWKKRGSNTVESCTSACLEGMDNGFENLREIGRDGGIYYRFFN